ncbi:MAG: DUF6471 domain-containing protein [Marinagarivorans sp.]|nr:DUF6471 domain-containing protein [Marinagarivorans sp.]
MDQQEWNKHAANFLKAEMAKQGVGYDDLIKRLGNLDVDETYKSISAKVNRGTFSFVFFMQCMKALNQKTVRFEE